MVVSDEMRVSEGGGAEEETENIEVMEMPFDTALDLMHEGKIRDAKTIMLLQWAKLNGLF